MGVSSTRVGDHRGSARTVQFLKIYVMSGDSLRFARASTGVLAETRPSVAAGLVGMCERRGLAVVLPQSGGFDSHPALRRKSDDPSQYHI